jgi:2-amino-4-hydroxy-6-hydroxymethyldihydropteridine diphosphokinase
MIKNTPNVYSHRLKFSQSAPSCGSNCLFLGLGANIAVVGQPRQTLARALAALARAGLRPLLCSRLLTTKPVGGGHQPDFLNAVVQTRANLAPMALLRLLKGLERQAGRRPGRRAGPRPLDIGHLGLWRPAPRLARRPARPRPPDPAAPRARPAHLCARSLGRARAPLAPSSAGHHRPPVAAAPGRQGGRGRANALDFVPPHAKSRAR